MLRRFLSFLAVLVFVLGLAACSQSPVPSMGSQLGEIDPAVDPP